MPSRGLEPQSPVLCRSEPTEDKPQGPVPGRHEEQAGPLQLTLLVLSSSTGACRTGLRRGFVKETTVFGKGGRGAVVPPPLLFLSFHFIVNPSSELI